MRDFSIHLACYGPGSSTPFPTLSEARSYCARLTRTHYENFTVASVLLPRRLLPHFQAVYAYCRWADDLADETGEEAPCLLDWWETELKDCFECRARHPVMVALQPTIERFQIPATPFRDLLTAFRQDQRVKEYESYADLTEYCRYSANPVGRLVLYLGECYDAERAALSDKICTALQLANFWQDVRRDWENLKRVYLPAEDRRRFGYLDGDLRAGKATPAFQELLRFEVERTRLLFEEGRPLLGMIPADLRVDVELFLEGGLAILRKIEAIHFDVWSTRPTIGKREKLGLLLRVVGRRWLDSSKWTWGGRRPAE